MKKLGKILALSSLMITAMMVAPLLTHKDSNNGVNEQALDFGVNGSALNFVHGQVFGKDGTVEVSKTFVQYGVTTYEGQEIKVLRFATAVKGEIESLAYSRDHIDGLEDKNIDVSTVYRSLNANGKSVYYDPSASSNGLTADASYANNYYWACYVVRFTSGDLHKDTDFTVRLSVNGEEKASVTKNLTDVIQSTSTCSHDLVRTAPVAATRHVNGTLGYYTCNECGKVYEDADALVETTVADRVDVSEGWTRFVPSSYESLNNAFVPSLSELDGVPATKITIASGTLAGTSTNLVPKSDKYPNTRTVLIKDVNTKFKLTVKNESNIEVGFRYFFDNYGDKLGHDMVVAANATQTFEFEGAFDTSTPGPWHGLKLNTDATEEISLYMHGEYTTNGYVDGEKVYLEKVKDASTKSFVVGQTFTSEGLMTRLNGEVCKNDWPNIDSYETNFDGHVFTNEDVGTRTVIVSFGGSSFTYDIEVVPPHVHDMIETAFKAATYNVDGTLGYFTCGTCHKVYADRDGENETTIADRVVKSDAWFKFAPRNEVSTGASGVTSVYETIDEKVFNDGTTYATRVSFNNEVNANTDINFCTGNSTQYGVNNRVPMHSGKQLDVKLFVKNHSTNSISFDYRLNDNDANSAVRVNLEAGEEKVIEATLSLKASTPGGWNRMIPVENIPAGSSFSIYGYIKTRDYQDFDGATNTIVILKEATQKAFIVGEKFNANGLIVKHSQASYETYVNASTNFDGHTFTASDVGTHTVQVQFGSAVTTYEIEVTKGHELNYVQGSATTWANGTTSHYECTLCGKLFADANAQNEITLNDVKVSNGAWARVTNKKQTFNNNNASAEYVNVQDEIFPEAGIIKATKVTFGGAINNGGSWDHPNNWDDHIAVQDGVNNRMPLIPGESVDYKYYLKNTGDSALSFKFQFWNDYSNTLAFEVALAPGETKILENTFVVPSNVANSGGWSRFIATGDIAQGAEFISYWYYSTTNNDYMNFNTTGANDSVYVEKAQNASKTTFKVGETFTAEGLILKLRTTLNGGPDGGNIYNFSTDFDGHTFTSADIGTKTVTVRFADTSITYTINVEA